MSDLSNYLESALINHVLRNTAMTSPVTVYIALFTAVTDAEAGTGTEVTGGAYARVAVAFDVPASPGGTTQNTALITFPTATAAWGTVTHAAIYDALTVGNPLTVIKALAASKVVGTGDIMRFPIGDIDFSLA